jgi:hypothetical protein
MIERKKEIRCLFVYGSSLVVRKESRRRLKKCNELGPKQTIEREQYYL